MSIWTPLNLQQRVPQYKPWLLRRYLQLSSRERAARIMLRLQVLPVRIIRLQFQQRRTRRLVRIVRRIRRRRRRRGLTLELLVNSRASLTWILHWSRCQRSGRRSRRHETWVTYFDVLPALRACLGQRRLKRSTSHSHVKLRGVGNEWWGKHRTLLSRV